MSSQSGVRTEPVAGGSGPDGPRTAGRPRRSPLLGIAALVLAVLVFLALPVATLLVDQPDFLRSASPISARVVAGQLVAMIVASGLAIAAVITRRGRSWGIAALGILVGLLLIGLVLPLFSR